MNLRHFQQRQRSGAAIIIVLCFIVLMAGLVVAFLGRATTERQVSHASVQGTRVEMLADMASDIIISDLRQEIITGSKAIGSGDHTLYVPNAAANSVPLRDESAPLLANYLRRSTSSDALTRASAVSSSARSSNGRYIDLARWNSHYLLPLAKAGTLGDSTPDSSFKAPDWVIVTRNGPVAQSGWNAALADARDSNGNFAIGRYAFAIYDEGGLLDVNAAGFPSNSTVSQFGTKGGLAYADLRQVSLTSTQMDQLVGWRNYASLEPSGAFPNLVFDVPAATRYQQKVWSGLNTRLTVAPTQLNGNTDRAILNRQQLISLLKTLSTDEAQRLKIQEALSSLGTFSRELNEPSWGPTVDYATPYNYKASQFDTGSAVYNPFVQNIRVGSAFTRGDGSAAVVGEPLVKSRFALEHLALLEKMQGATSLSGQDKDDIARLFGLDPVTDSNGHFRHWSYPTTNNKYAQGSAGIMSLAEVAALNREPNFFELLQAGILAGSLGKGGGRGDVLNGGLGYSTATFNDPDTKITLQLLRIGANIIDQWDADNFPTAITFAPTGDPVYGIEDLPYVNKMLFNVSGTGNPAVPYDQEHYTFKVGFQLWNPHQALPNPGAYPAGLRMVPFHNESTPEISDSYQMGVVVNNTTGTGPNYPTWYYNAKTSTWGTAWDADFFADTESQGVIPITYGTPASAYREPAPVPAITLRQMLGMPPDSVTKNGMTFSGLRAAGGSAWIYFKLSVTYKLQYLDQTGNYRTYATFVGLDNQDLPVPGTGYRQAPWLPFSNMASTPERWYGSPKSDPRTFRFGSGQTDAWNVENSTMGLSPSASLRYTMPNNVLPFMGGSGAAYRLDQWARNPASGAQNNPTNPAYKDRDDQVRPGDYLNSAVLPLYSAANGGVPARPIILNRPFRSVGELGYVFRDMPWKTLDLNSAKSADAGLLDLFTIQAEQPVVAGRLNPNTRQKAALTALITNTSTALGSGATIPVDKAAAVADAMITLSKTQPFTNRADLVTRLMADPAVTALSDIKTEREAIIRAVADGTNTRTWNLMIDVVTQVGRYPRTATSLSQFTVEGERHHWLHLAIDRYTGKIVDQQIEVVRK